MHSPKHISVLGSTGSIGTQAVEVLREHPGRFTVDALTAQNNASLLIAQARELKPKLVVIGNENKFYEVKEALQHTGTEVLCGKEGLLAAATGAGTDLVLTAIVGFAGLEPTIAAISAGKDIALANKETLVVAGELVMSLAQEKKIRIIPVDSEHSAIFQCLQGEKPHAVEKVYLTASGGPFRGRSAEYLGNVRLEDALKHPNWVMGAKITIDSASLMNKGLEVIEAKWMFNLDMDQIDVIVHPQSVIHSMVQFCDGSIKAQMGLPDMKLPIQYALAYPERAQNRFERFDFARFPNLSFEQADKSAFPNLALAFEALERGGNMPCIINAANEVVVAGFLNRRIGFLQMSEVIEKCMQKADYVKLPSLDDYLHTDRETRILAGEMVTKLGL